MTQRLGFPFTNDSEIRSFFAESLEKNAKTYGRLHWLILDHGMAHCKKKPLCAVCPFEEGCF